ncbi:MAG TPA: DNA translocase FtsK 4TM domain-containing protein [Alphaproteobacteria bacterium]|nr:DNA translocase FtsK 4TM domain-containing protein [Alphaproteobacteria bacterium]
MVFSRSKNLATSFFRSRLYEIVGLSFLLFSLTLSAALLSHTPTDPSWNLAADSEIQNLLGSYGAIISDLFLQFIGPLSYVLAFFLLVMGAFLFTHPKGLSVFLRGVLFLCGFFLLLSGLSFWGNGGALGYILLKRLSEIPLPPLILSLVLLALGLPLLLFTGGLKFSHLKVFFGFIQKRPRKLKAVKKNDCSQIVEEDKTEVREIPKDTGLRLKNYIKSRPKNKDLSQPPSPKTFYGGEPYQLPPLELLYLPRNFTQKIDYDEDSLRENAEALETVLNDYGIRGEIVGIKPGPVVTLYELEPAAGVKSSRVIALADDIARSMSAISARVAVVLGKNVIGIELPNKTRETVHLRDLLAHDEYEKSKAHLSLILGKDISGAPIIADLARMPHLLVAGTTGSGKSVAVNAMILSLIYRLPPERCKFIMIDPKMLELSIYDGIPHLLAPVVTEPKKAVVALRWVVREMESRYQAMSKLSVRNIEGYNQRILEAKSRGETISRRVQTGFDPETGKPIFEEQPLSMEALPFIVVVVDEMADLMLVAGKEIESAVQRLAQMARAAGIHLIMATQRPSVDVITGTIKANFPTRISFQVSSKIDSRTILNEQGAEQLLGQGDMLYMASGGRISRVHGPYVGDEDVEKVVQFLKSQSEPSYKEDITIDPSAPELDFESEEGSKENALYQQALALVYREGKASTSFIQRHLKIGYNRAACLIEQMEQEGIVSSPNHVGKREVLGRGSQEN